MRKLILLTFLLIGNYSFSQYSYRIDKNLNDGKSGRYSFKVIGEITFGRPVFGSEDTFPSVPKMHYPVIFKNIKIVSITTPNGSTYSNNDLVYKTDSQYYPNGIKLPIILSNSQALKHFSIDGNVNFNGIKTPFIKSTGAPYPENEFWKDHAGFKRDIYSKIENNLEKSGRLKGLKIKEKHNEVIKKLKEMFYSKGTTPKITEVIFNPYGKGSKDLGNLIQLASSSENRNTTPSGTTPNQQTTGNNPPLQSRSKEIDNANQKLKDDFQKRVRKKAAHKAYVANLNAEAMSKIDQLAGGNVLAAGIGKTSYAIATAIGGGTLDANTAVDAAGTLINGLMANAQRKREEAARKAEALRIRRAEERRIQKEKKRIEDENKKQFYTEATAYANNLKKIVAKRKKYFQKSITVLPTYDETTTTNQMLYFFVSYTKSDYDTYQENIKYPKTVNVTIKEEAILYFSPIYAVQASLNGEYPFLKDIKNNIIEHLEISINANSIQFYNWSKNVEKIATLQQDEMMNAILQHNFRAELAKEEPVVFLNEQNQTGATKIDYWSDKPQEDLIDVNTNKNLELNNNTQIDNNNNSTPPKKQVIDYWAD